MANPIKEPAAEPCASCPYRLDVPSGIWAAQHYDQLAAYDQETGDQPLAVFLCHLGNGRLCAGWAGCHDMQRNLAIRAALVAGILPPDTFHATCDYQTDAALFASGAEAAAHGKADIDAPSPEAIKAAGRIERRRARTDLPVARA